MQFKRDVLKNVVVVTAQPVDQPGSGGLAEVKDVLIRFFQQGDKRVLLDISALDLIDSRGIGALVGCVRLAQQRDGVFVICSPQPRVFQTLELLNLGRVLAIRMDRDEAVTALQKLVLKPESYEQLLSANPTPDKVLAWWNQRSKELKEEADKSYQKRDLAPVAVPSHEQPVVESAPPEAVEPAIGPPRRGEEDWVQALRLYSQLREVASRNGVEITPENSFQELFGKLAAKIARPF